MKVRLSHSGYRAYFTFVFGLWPPVLILHPMIRFGSLELKSNLFLSPLAGYTNLPFRLALREDGGLDLATADINGTNFYLEWQDVGANPPTWTPSPKQHDGEAMNIEDLAFRSTSEMIFGLRAPLSNRTNGNAYYFMATNFGTFLPSGGWTGGQMNGLAGPYEMNLAGLGFRSIKWCPHGLTNVSEQEVQRYLVLAG